jgi:hypothetical protein
MIIGFSTTNRIFSRLIKWATRSRASHAFVMVKVAGEPIIIHATHNGVNCDHYKVFKKSKKIVVQYKLEVPEENKLAATATALKLLDRPYDFLSIVGFGWVLFNKALGRQTKNPFRNRTAYQCSEFALEILRAAGVKGLDQFDRELVSPEDLMNFLSNYSNAEKL